MAEVRNNLSMKLKGRAGAYTFYSSKGRQIARVAQNSSNYGDSARRSLSQQTRRVKWANLVNFYKKSKVALRGAFTTKRANETDYNAFMRKNLPQARVALTKDEAAQGIFIPDSFQISEGEFQTITEAWTKKASADVFASKLLVDTEEEPMGLTVALISRFLVNLNSQLREGMQVTFFNAFAGDVSQSPDCYVQFQELTIDLNDRRSISNVWKVGTLTFDTQGRLAVSGLSEDSWCCWILSDSTSGKLLVSTEFLLPGDESAVEEHSSEAAVLAAAESYGLDPEVFLASGDYQP